MGRLCAALCLISLMIMPQISYGGEQYMSKNLLVMRLNLGAFQPLAAKKSYDDIYGNPCLEPGISLFYKDMETGMDVGLEIMHSFTTGEYVMMEGGELVPSGTKATLGITAINISLEYNLGPDSYINPFIGGGLGKYFMRETGFSSRESLGYFLLGGLELNLQKEWSLNCRLLYNTVPDSLGHRGTSKYRNETDMGGIHLLLGLNYRLPL